MANLLKASLRAPEGKWVAASERRATTNYSADLLLALTVAELQDDEADRPAQFLVFNSQASLIICYPPALDRDPLRVIDFRYLSAGGSSLAYPTCHAHTSTAKDEFDLAVGMSTGEVVLLSLRAQLKAAATNTRPVSSFSVNVDGSAAATRCMSLAWLPGSQGTAFLAAHRDGSVLLYHKVVGSSSDTKLLARSSSSHSLRPPITQLQGPGGGGGATAAAVSPDGLHVAVACRDGVLRVYAYPGGGLVAGFKSYYGGLLCCCWSPDGRYVAAGGEDDMLAVYGLAERCVVAYCQGHTSWVSGVAFDPWMCHADNGSSSSRQQQQQQQQQLGEGSMDIDGQQQQQGQGQGRQLEAGGRSEGSSGGAATTTSTAAAVPAVPPVGERVYRLASVGQDCQVALWDVVVSQEAVAAAQQASSAGPSPERGRFPPGLPPSPSKRRGGGSSRSSSPSKRGGIPSGLKQRGGGSSSGGGGGADPGALPAALAAGIIAPPLPRADWPLVTPVVLQRVHPEPACAAVFTADALYTACQGSCVRRWARPPLTQQAVMKRNDSLQNMQQEQQGER